MTAWRSTTLQNFCEVSLCGPSVPAVGQLVPRAQTWSDARSHSALLTPAPTPLRSLRASCCSARRVLRAAVSAPRQHTRIHSSSTVVLLFPCCQRYGKILPAFAACASGLHHIANGTLVPPSNRRHEWQRRPHRPGQDLLCPPLAPLPAYIPFVNSAESPNVPTHLWQCDKKPEAH